jgi:hypothetical protein
MYTSNRFSVLAVVEDSKGKPMSPKIIYDTSTSSTLIEPSLASAAPVLSVSKDAKRQGILPTPEKQSTNAEQNVTNCLEFPVADRELSPRSFERQLEQKRRKRKASAYGVKRGKQEISLRPLRSHSLGAPSANQGPTFHFYGECFYCMYPSHSQKYCPLKQCKRCMNFGHSQSVCVRAAENKNKEIRFVYQVAGSGKTLNNSLFQSTTMSDVTTRDFPEADN